MSKLLKNDTYFTSQEPRLLSTKHPISAKVSGAPSKESAPLTPQPDIDATTVLKDQILRDAESYAHQVIIQANQQIEEAQLKAKAEMDEWWKQQRELDATYIASAQDSGYAEGYKYGKQEAEEHVKQEYKDIISQARDLLQEVTAEREKYVEDSESFLISLSCLIAEKIIGHKLEQDHGLALEIVTKVLTRRREHGTITLCVAPSQYTFIKGSEDELKSCLDAQDELVIVPDSSIVGHGCIIRSPFGSIDATVSTQLEEIKYGLQQIAGKGDVANS